MTYKHDTLPIDEKLVQFTDQFLDGDINEIAEDDTDLAALADTVQKLHAAFDEEIDGDKAEEIRKKVKASWHNMPNTRKRSQSKQSHWFSWTSQRRFRTAASVAMILILVILTPALLTNTPLMVGSAGILSQKTLLFAILGLILAVILILTLRQKK